MCTHNNYNICPISKQTKLSFSFSAINTQRPFDLLHDIWGPHNKSPTYSNA